MINQRNAGTAVPDCASLHPGYSSSFFARQGGIIAPGRAEPRRGAAFGKVTAKVVEVLGVDIAGIADEAGPVVHLGELVELDRRYGRLLDARAGRGDAMPAH